MKRLVLAGLLVGCSGTEVKMLIDAPGGGAVTSVSGHITASTTWSGTIDVTAATTIDPGVTVTVMPGTALAVATGAGITIDGTLAIQGTSAEKVNVYSAPPNTMYLGLEIPAGGQLTTSYLVQTGGGIHVSGTGKATLIDSQMSHMTNNGLTGDFLTMAGGTLDVEYSWLGVESGTPDTTHCDLHFDGAGNTIKVTHTNISTGAFATMFYGGTGADFTYDNWFGNTVDVATQPGVSGDFSHGWFARTPPSGAGITATNMATARLTDAGPRP